MQEKLEQIRGGGADDFHTVILDDAGGPHLNVAEVAHRLDPVNDGFFAKAHVALLVR